MYRILIFKHAKAIVDHSITGGKWVHIFRTEKEKNINVVVKLEIAHGQSWNSKFDRAILRFFSELGQDYSMCLTYNNRVYIDLNI